MASTSKKFIAIQLHGCGVANSGDYPDICVSLEITFTRSSSTSKTVSWSVGGVDLSTGSADSYRYDYPFYAKLVVGSSSHSLISKGSTSGSGWRNSITLYEDFSGSFSSTSSSVTVKFQVEAGHCMNNGSYCYGESGWYTVYSGSASLPSYKSSSSGGGGGSGGNTGYKIYYDANYGNLTGAAEQSITSNTTITTSNPDYPINVKYFTGVGSHYWSENEESAVIHRQFLGWKAYYARTNSLTAVAPVDGTHYVYPRAGALPYDVKEIKDKTITLRVRDGYDVPVYHWLSGTKPKDSKYPYYYALDQRWREGDYDIKDTRWITTGTLSNAPHGIWSAKSPPEGTNLIINYTSIEYEYSSPSGIIYQPGDTYNPPSGYSNKDVYMVAQWGDAPVVPVPIPPDYKKVILEYNGGTGPFNSMDVERTPLGYLGWYQEWVTYDKEGGTLPGPYYQPGHTYSVAMGNPPPIPANDTIYIPHINRKLERNLTMGLTCVRDSARLRKEDLPIPDKEGYVFKGWYYDPQLTQPVADVTEIKKEDPDLYLYAKYVEIPIRRFDIDGEWKFYNSKVWRFNGTSWEQVADVYKFNDNQWNNLTS